MRKTISSDLADRITTSLTDANTCLWFPHLTYDLVKIGWRNLKGTRITVSNYGTARVVLGNSGASRNVVFSLPILNESGNIKDIILIELLPEKITQQYEDSGVKFYTAEEIYSSEVLNCLKDAFQIIKQVPSLFMTVVSLVKSMHLIKPESDDYDLSFSEPNVPFSIFVSVPQQNSEINALRVAEAVVHEAMHLQLTFIEQLILIIIDNEENYYSPWKEEYRTSQGVFHALYVFRVIHDLLETLLAYNNISVEQASYIQDRRLKINKQIEAIKSFGDSPALTKIASNFVKRLIIV